MMEMPLRVGDIVLVDNKDKAYINYSVNMIDDFYVIVHTRRR